MSKKPEGLSWKGYEGRDYENFWAGEGKHYLDLVEQAVIAGTLPGGDGIVEIGAGFGRLGPCYVGKYQHVHMVEPASNLREIAARTYGRAISYHDASAEELPFETGSLDAALMVRVFHHLGKPEVALREIGRVLKPGGRLVFNYSNKRNLKRVALSLIGRGGDPFTLDMEAYGPNLIGHHPKHVEALLKRAGFSIEQQYGVGFVDKAVEVVPALAKLIPPSAFLSRCIGGLLIAPAQFILAIKK